MSNYEIVGFNEFAFNSLTLYNFRIDEATLSKFVESKMKIHMPEHKVTGSLNMNKLLLSSDFKLEATIDLQ